jgi:hypothetical protein
MKSQPMIGAHQMAIHPHSAQMAFWDYVFDLQGEELLQIA